MGFITNHLPQQSFIRINFSMIAFVVTPLSIYSLCRKSVPLPIKPNHSKLTQTRSVPPSPRSVSDHEKIGQTSVLRRDFPLPQQNNVPPARLVYLRRFAKLIEVLPSRNSATCAKVVAFCSATCYNMPCPWGYSSVGRALEWHSRGQGFDSPYLHHLPKRSDRSGLFFFLSRADGGAKGVHPR